MQISTSALYIVNQQTSVAYIPFNAIALKRFYEGYYLLNINNVSKRKHL